MTTVGTTVTRAPARRREHRLAPPLAHAHWLGRPALRCQQSGCVPFKGGRRLCARGSPAAALAAAASGVL